MATAASQCPGKRAIESLLSEQYAHPSRPTIENKEEAKEWITRLMEEYNFFFRVEKQEHRVLEIDSNQFFDEQAYYCWQWESPWARLKSTLFSILLIVVVLIGVMFPLWPSSLRLGVWYVSMGGLGLIGALVALAIIRLILYVISLVFPCTRPGIWLFPNLFADVGVIDSFIPVWGWQGTDYEQMHKAKYRKQKKEKKGGKKKKSSKKSKGTNDEAGTDGTDGDVIAPRSAEQSEEQSAEDDIEEIAADEVPKSKDV